ncbi:universal stress protein [Citricoccus sp. NR2]|uniref:universal stress protein n=1 Tax=Citricoccus sp. NR2 TaxID=3004095 RepID=UPI0022DDB718|nr:universal stress protein [Citricoccus sp. NR2]WBL20356.1 universal stress protein [Citricoccus sp. NR2]
MTIIVGYTPSEQAQAALDQGLRLARLSGENVVVVNAGPGGENRHPSQLRDKDKVALQEKLQAASDVESEYRELLRGKSTVEEFVTLCAELDPSYVVIGNRKRSGFGRFMMGSVTDELLRALQHPVLCVKPAASPRPEHLPTVADPDVELAPETHLEQREQLEQLEDLGEQPER